MRLTRPRRPKHINATPNPTEGTRMIRSPAAGLLCLALAACGGKADLVVTGGMLWTGLSRGGPRPGAVAIARGKILAVGGSGVVARYLKPRTPVLAAPAGVVIT